MRTLALILLVSLGVANIVSGYPTQSQLATHRFGAIDDERKTPNFGEPRSVLRLSLLEETHVRSVHHRASYWLPWLLHECVTRTVILHTST